MLAFDHTSQYATLLTTYNIFERMNSPYRVNEVCPIWPGQPITAHWGVFDPAAAPEKEKHLACAKAFAILERRILLFTSLPMASLERMALERSIRDIGNSSAS